MKSEKQPVKSDNLNRMYFFENFADEFDQKVNLYDTKKRLDVVFNDLLWNIDLKDKITLDAGCGTGWFSKEAILRGAEVYSMDLGENLLSKVSEKCGSKTIVGSILDIPFDDNYFDIIISSEVLEHTPDPILAIKELYRVLKPNGICIITTPNKLWYFSVYLANLLHLRPYEGLENWIGWMQMNRELKKTGFTILDMLGIHIIPFQLKALHPVLDYFHKYRRSLGPVMINMAVKCTK
jgi:2-polyprenyl-3-methyl-5-hydroxy-6-metoxy-1,4-benzoquinol methylase